MEIGRNLEYDEGINMFAVVIRYDFETTVRRWHFDTHRKAVRKFNQLRKQGAAYFNVHADPTI